MFSIFETDNPVESVAEKYRNGNFVKALNEVNKALKDDPKNSDLLYYRVKIRLQLFYFHQNEYKALDIISLIDQMQDIADLNDPIIPFYNTIHDPFERHGTKNILGINPVDLAAIDQELKNIELTNFPLIINDLRLIYDGKTEGSIDRNYIKSDFGMLLIMYGLVKLRDTSNDNNLDLSDYQFPIKYQDADARFTKLPKSFIADKYIRDGIHADTIAVIQAYMNANGIPLVDNDQTGFQPGLIDSHREFFDLHIYKFLIQDLRSFTVNIENVRSSFISVINSDAGNEGALYEGIQVIEDIIKSDTDDDVKKLTTFLDDLRDELDSFSKASMERDLWYSNIVAEITDLILGKN